VQRRIQAIALLLVVAAPGGVVHAQGTTEPGLDLVSLFYLAEYGAVDEKNLEGRSVQVYRIPIGIRMRDEVERGWGLKLMLPVSIGGYELRAATDVGDLVERIETVTIYPGVEFQVPVGERWFLRPYAEVGVISAFGDRGSEELYAAGVKWRVELGGESVRWRLGGEGRFSVGTSPAGDSIDFMELAIGPEVSIPLGVEIAGQAADLAPFALYRRFSGLEIPLPDRDPASLERQYEVGLTFGTEPRHVVWGIRMPRVGVSYRFGDGIDAWRIVFGFPF
jgi:hypothetical protein